MEATISWMCELITIHQHRGDALSMGHVNVFVSSEPQLEFHNVVHHSASEITFS